MSENTSQDLESLRARIDEIDEQVQLLLNERARCAQQVASVKIKEAKDKQPKFYRPERKAQVLRKVMARNKGPIDNESMARLFREVMSTCLALENPLQVAYLGPEGTFTQAAALKHFGHGVVNKSLMAIDDVFREVESGSVQYGVVPVENSTEGVVNHTLDSFLDSCLLICGEVELRIHQHLLCRAGQAKEDIKTIYSHQQSLGQCRKWLDQHWSGVELVAVSSNAEAARIAKEKENAAAVAGEMSAELYGLEKIAENIEDNPNNTTRFLIIGKDPVPASGEDKTSILVSTRNRPGALFRVLEPFHKLDISLTRIETRPSKAGTWTYVFFIDYDGHRDDEKSKSLFELLGSEVAELRHLGSYPKAVL